MNNVTGTLNINGEEFTKALELSTFDDIAKFVKGMELTLLTQMGIDIYEYEQWKTPEYYTVSEAAQRWGVKRNTLISSIQRGKLQEYKNTRFIKAYKKKDGKNIYYLSEYVMDKLYGKVV